MTATSDEQRLLDVAESLFYSRGFQAVGMDALRDASGLSLKRIYALFPGKEAIAVAMLDRRDTRWFDSLASHVESVDDPTDRVLAVFDWLHRWLASEGYRGCAWINAFGELGGGAPGVVAAVRRHKARLRDCITRLVATTGTNAVVAEALFLLVEGSMVTAGIEEDPGSALKAKQVAMVLLGIDGDTGPAASP